MTDDGIGSPSPRVWPQAYHPPTRPRQGVSGRSSGQSLTPTITGWRLKEIPATVWNRRGWYSTLGRNSVGGYERFAADGIGTVTSLSWGLWSPNFATEPCIIR